MAPTCSKTLNKFTKITSDLALNLKQGLEWRLRQLYDASRQRRTIRHRLRLNNTVFIGITGSAGKTTTKDLIASILDDHLLTGTKNPGSLNWPEDMVRSLLSTQRSDAYCVIEISAHGPGTMELPLSLIRPRVGVVTQIGFDHLSAFPNRDAIAAEKGKLICALPPDGIAVLNADDPRVLAMRSLFSGRTVTFGLTPQAQLQGDGVTSNWPERLSLTAHWQGESVRVSTQLCGVHWAPVVLAALATGVALGTSLKDAAESVSHVAPFDGRMAPKIIDDITFICDDWKSPLSTIEPAFNFMRNACATRKIIVIGTLSDYQGDSTRRYTEVALSALAIADCVVFVGPRASAALRARQHADDPLLAFSSLHDAAQFLKIYLKPGDLVLLKGSHKADHMQRLMLARSTGIKCWGTDCGHQHACLGCAQLQTPSGKQTPEPFTWHKASFTTRKTTPEKMPLKANTTFVIGLGNPESGRLHTPHNVGYATVDLLARRIAQDWVKEGELAHVARGELNGAKVCLVKLMSPMNDVGPPLASLSAHLNFNPAQCILVHDDLDLPLGSVKSRQRGGDGGHLGLRSIIQTFQEDRFRRIKIGIKKAQLEQTVAHYVLTPFTPFEREIVNVACNTAADRIFNTLQEAPQP
jgi:UDP-N-acetylmuramoyl-tripeptide--D-alanyl-D-alanine ligase